MGRRSSRSPVSLALLLVSSLMLMILPSAGVAEEVPRFSDVPTSHTFAVEISWLADRGVTEGRGDGTFGVDDPVTRGAMAAFLYRFAGYPSVPTGLPGFEDVPDDHGFAQEIAWLASTGVTQGRGDGTFGVDDPVTRGAMAAFLYRFAEQPAVLGDHPTFADVPADHVFADAIAWLASTGITQGRGDGSFGLNDPVTRGQMAAFLFRFHEGAPPAPGTEPDDGPVFTVSETAIADLSFGTPAAEVIAFVEGGLGPSDSDTGWTEYFELEIDAPDALDGYYRTPYDDFDWYWSWPWYREVCWEMFCIQLGGDTPSDASVRGWTLNAVGDQWVARDPIPVPPTPWVAIADTNVTLGSNWSEVQQAYPQAELAAGEGADVHVNGVWDDYTWRLSWRNDFASSVPDAPPDAQLIFLSAGTQRGFPCC